MDSILLPQLLSLFHKKVFKLLNFPIAYEIALK